MTYRPTLALQTIGAAFLVLAGFSAWAGEAPERPGDIEQRLERLLQRFPDADANKDGKLTVEEARAYRKKAMQKRRGGGSGKREIAKDYAIKPDHADVRYGPHPRNAIDLWLAKSGNGSPTPLAIFIHGGGFKGGDKKKVNMGAVRRFLDAGVSVATINYRLIDSGPFPIPMHDGARALQFLRHHAARYNLEKKRFGCFGGSAGGCMSMWLAFHDDLADPDSKDPVLRESTRIVCAAPSGGQSCLDRNVLLEWFQCENLKEHPSTRGFFGIETLEELGKPEIEARMREASPISHLTKDDPPVFASYGAADVPVDESTDPGTWVHHPRLGIKLKERMDRIGVECHVKYKDGPPVREFKDGVDFMIRKLKE